MSKSPYNRWQRAVRWFARRVPPTHKRGFPAAFGTVIFIFAFLIIPKIFLFIQAAPLVGKLLHRPYVAPWVLTFEILLIAFGTFIGVSFWARVIELSWSEYFNALDERHM